MPDDTNMAIDGAGHRKAVVGSGPSDAWASANEKFELLPNSIERPAATAEPVERVRCGQIFVALYLYVRTADATRHLEEELTPARFGFVSEALREQIAHGDPVTADLIRRLQKVAQASSSPLVRLPSKQLVRNSDRHPLRMPRSSQASERVSPVGVPEKEQNEPLVGRREEDVLRSGDNQTRLWTLRLRELASRCAYSSTQLGHELGVSRRQLHRLFVARLKQSPQRWLNEERLLEARRRLERANSVKEVAFFLHFRSQAHFSRAFKQHFGTCPSAFLGSNETAKRHLRE